jgi:predicted TPR repeat methyltransferase
MENQPAVVRAAQSSGDLIADRRLGYAAAYTAQGDHAAARDLLAQTVERAPAWAPAWVALGDAEASLGHIAAACGAYRRALAVAPDDCLGASLKLAKFGRPPPDSAPEAYVRQLFDDYAAHFEAHLVGRLAYRGPQLLADAIDGLGRTQFSRAIDLGCGTGLCGVALRARAQQLIGVDLSAAMIAEARAKQIYDRLVVQEITAFLAAERPGCADLVLAADVLVYIGDLTPLFAAARRALAPSGLFAFTAQRGTDRFELGSDLRFAHAPLYISHVAAAAGFTLRVMKDIVKRLDRGRDVPSLLAVLEK